MTLYIAPHDLFDQFVPFHFHDEAAGSLVVSHIGGVAGHDIPDDLADRIIPFFGKSFVNNGKDLLNTVDRFWLDPEKLRILRLFFVLSSI